MSVFAQSLVVMPDSLKIVLAGLVLFAVRYLLSKWFPDAALSEIAAGITTALFVMIGALLGMIPPEFEAIANAALQLLAVLLGSVIVVNGYIKARERGFLS